MLQKHDLEEIEATIQTEAVSALKAHFRGGGLIKDTAMCVIGGVAGHYTLLVADRSKLANQYEAIGHPDLAESLRRDPPNGHVWAVIIAKGCKATVAYKLLVNVTKGGDA